MHIYVYIYTYIYLYTYIYYYIYIDLSSLPFVSRDPCLELYEEESSDLLLLGCVYATISAANFPRSFHGESFRNGRATAVTVTPDGNWHALLLYTTFNEHVRLMPATNDSY